MEIRELSDKEFYQVWNKLIVMMGKETADDIMYNEVAYLYNDRIVYHDGTVVPVRNIEEIPEVIRKVLLDV